MTTGKQLAALLLLSTALTVPGIAYAQDSGAGPGAAGPAGGANVGSTGAPSAGAGVPPPADAPAGASDALLEEVEGVDNAPADAEAAEPEISVSGGSTIVVTGRRTRDPQRNSSQVISVLSSEQIARTGEGDIAGALGRVTGLSVVGNGLVYVRGLGDRYSLALLNGLPLPSPEPLSRVVPLDIFPTNVIASSLVQKTYSPNFPGEFGGGVINLTTRAVPEESFLTISGGLSGDTQTTFQNGYAYYGGESDWTGFDNGVRDIQPALQNFLDASINEGLTVQDLITTDANGGQDFSQVEAIGRTLTPPRFGQLQIIGDLRPNFAGGITGGTAIDVGDDGRLGVIATASLSNEFRNRDIARQNAGPNDTTLARDENQFVTDNSMLFNAMVAVGLEFGEHTIRFTNLFIRDTIKQASLTQISDFREFPGADILSQNTAWYERQLIDTQAVGEFEFGPLSLDLRGGFARTDREAPYNLTHTYARTNDPTDFLGEYYRIDLSRSGQQALQETGVEVVFADLYEELWYGGADLSYDVSPQLSATVGYAYTDTDRYSERRGFQFDVDVDPDFYVTDPDTQGSGFPPNGLNSLSQVLSIVGLRSPDLILNGATYNMFNVGLIDQNEADPAFEAELTVHAGYAQAQWVPTDTLTIQGGVRYEDAQQSTTPVGALNQATAISKSNDYWLPGVTLTWEPIENLQLRAAGSRTIARPQFRELVRQRYFDPETNRQYSGNPFLTDSELLNFEGRAEYYLGGQSRISLAGFYKKIEDPIEVYVGLVTGDRFISYANAPSATLYGGELELSYAHDLYDLGGWFETKQVILVGNYTYTQSDLSVSDADTVIVTQGENVITAPALTYFSDGAPLVGQSDHLVNLQLGFEDVETLQQFTVLFSYASDRVSLRGSNQLPDVIEEPGIGVDIVFRQGLDLFGTEAEAKFEARNIFANGHSEYQVNANGLRIENNTYDVGAEIGASLSITF